MALTSTDAVRLNSSQQAQIEQYTQAWNDAHAAGNVQGMNSAHNAAEAVRNQAGYSSDASGFYASDINNTIMEQAFAPVPNLGSVLDQARTISDYNTAQNQLLAEKQWAFNAAEAQKARDWQEYMSNTSMQRYVKDAKAAGLNPILFSNAGASVGSGATASGATASADTSMNSILGQYLGSLISSATAINQANINAKTSMAVANINRDASMYMADAYPSLNQVLGQALKGAGDSVGNIIDSVIDWLSDLSENGFGRTVGTTLIDASSDKHSRPKHR